MYFVLIDVPNHISMPLIMYIQVDQKLEYIMKRIHQQCVKHGKRKGDGYIDYVKGANLAGFVKVADAMIAQGCV